MGEVATLAVQVAVNSPTPWEAFWTLYPRREAKKDAVRAWSKMVESDYPAILEALVQWRNVWRQQNRTTNMIPLPASWLNGERWTDEIPAEFQAYTSMRKTPNPLLADERMERLDRQAIPVAVQKVLDQMLGRKSA